MSQWNNDGGEKFNAEKWGRQKEGEEGELSEGLMAEKLSGSVWRLGPRWGWGQYPVINVQ
jgi:hypothetical protein